MAHKKCFTLFEVMIALSILAMAAVGMGRWKVHRVLESKRFHSDVAKLHSRLLTCHHLALTMQADWEGVLEQQGKRWVFMARCVEQPEVQKFAPMALAPFSLLLDGAPQARWVVEFSATGAVGPAGVVQLVQKQNVQEEWRIPELFAKASGSKRGPIRPL